jgi:hypothetical protein
MPRSSAIVLVERDLDVEDRRSGDRLEIRDPRTGFGDFKNSRPVKADGSGRRGDRVPKHAALWVALVATGMNAQDLAVCQMQPGDDENLAADRQPSSAGAAHSANTSQASEARSSACNGASRGSSRLD